MARPKKPGPPKPEKKLTPLQQDVLKRIRHRGLYMVARTTEDRWMKDLTYYLDDRVKGDLRGIVQDFNRANQEVRDAKIQETDG